tara:strand:- start:33 stop:734 length:702 start_codon:yes stop_codon:yes gene_type:complete
MDSSIIIARYNENLNWIKKLNNSSQIIIYNKGDSLQNSEDNIIIELPNVGRESHTWLHHIYYNYENLSDYNIFLQGRIDDLGCMAYSDISNYFADLRKKSFSTSRFGIIGPLHWKPNLNIHKDSRYVKAWNNGELSRSNLGFRKYSKLFFKDIPFFIATSYGGCFGVTKDAIRKNNKDFYYKLLVTVDKHPNPIESHYLERLWCYMFSRNKYITNAFSDVIKTKIERNLNFIT